MEDPDIKAVAGKMEFCFDSLLTGQSANHLTPDGIH